MAEEARKESTASAEPNSPAAQKQSPPSEASTQQQAAKSTSPTSPTPAEDRRGSDEWDASKVPPSRFQKRKGSIYAVPSSRDGHVDSNYAAKYYEKLAEMGYSKGK